MMGGDEVSVTEAAMMLGISTHAVRALITRGVLPARKFSTVYVLRLGDVRAYQQRQATRRKPGPKPAALAVAPADLLGEG